ncbi:MAG: 16S rRNA (cytosine(1402)-N(4))-methyltransferase RsmH [Vallitaleaceae bacterium]|nr:16S rRNA (cytosine(1402)-N(4))-methyltransferase RsmH [Vallitaleaceae bacterium]
MSFEHISVMLHECINGLRIKENGIYVDGTLGGAGHSLEICKQLKAEGLLIGIDQDEEAIEAASKKLKEMTCQVKLVRSNYEHFAQILSELNLDKVDGVLLDLGVSSHQLDTAQRGFSYMKEAELDMRMDQRQEKTAKDIVNQYSENELKRILKVYGEEKFADKIVKAILVAREQKEIETTTELVKIIDACIPNKFKIMYGHPAKRTFQALRIELNRELEVLENTIQTMIELLNPGGRLCIITFHSLEDRIVKHIFRSNENPCTCPTDFPICVCGKKPTGRVISRKPILPSEEEFELNSRSKSAKLRIFERTGEKDEPEIRYE